VRGGTAVGRHARASQYGQLYSAGHRAERAAWPEEPHPDAPLLQALMEDRQDSAEIIIAFNNDPKYLVGSGDESNFGAEGGMGSDRCFEVNPEDEDSVPDTIRFAPDADPEDQGHVLRGDVPPGPPGPQGAQRDRSHE